MEIALRQGDRDRRAGAALPERPVAFSVITTGAPAQGCSERSLVVLASPTPLAVLGSCSASFGASISARGGGLAPAPPGLENSASALATP